MGSINKKFFKKNFKSKFKNKIKNNENFIKTKFVKRSNNKTKEFKNKNIKRALFFIPSLITCSSILCGLWAMFLCFTSSNIKMAIILIIIASVIDALDGRIARFLNVSGKFGIELDSLADFLSFGVAPMIIYFYSFNWQEEIATYAIISIFPIFMSLRLAKFNMVALEPMKNKKIVDFRKNFFFGLAAPIGAIVLMLPAILNLLELYNFSNQNYAVIYVFVVSLLLVIPIPAFSHKMLHIGFKKKIDAIFTLFILFLVAFLIYNPILCALVTTTAYILTIPISTIIYNKGIAKLEHEFWYAKW